MNKHTTERRYLEGLLEDIEADLSYYYEQGLSVEDTPMYLCERYYQISKQLKEL